jgi:prepilin-type N-terminal cleavage/methylation domain-containing protein
MRRRLVSSYCMRLRPKAPLKPEAGKVETLRKRSMNMLTRSFVSRLRLRLASEGGFTLIELMVAIGIILVALLAMAYVATIGFSDIALARQRQSANGLANEAIEQVRALPFDTLKAGLANNDVGADANITVNTCGIPPPTLYCYGGERIPTGNNPAVVPLVPHQRSITVGPTTYTVSTYVTYFNNDVNSSAFRITVLVDWTNPARGGVSTQVQTQTVAFSGEGCLSEATHPFAGPCQPFFYGNASAAEGRVEITGEVADIEFESASVLTPSESSNLQVEQISSTQGITKGSGATMKLPSQAEQTQGSELETSGAENDPSAPGLDYSTTPLLGTGGALQAADGNGRNSITVANSASDVGSTTSTTSASIVNPIYPCPVTGLSENDYQPCGSSKARQVGGMVADLQLKKNTDLGTARLVDILAAPVEGSSFTHRQLEAGADGLIHSVVTRSLGTVTLGALPSGLDPSAVPVGWAGYFIRISGYSDSVTAQTGTSTAIPVVTRSGTVSYWNGVGYSSIAIVPGAAANIPVASVLILDDVGGKLLSVEIQGAVDFGCAVWLPGCPTTGGSSTSETILSCNPACPNTRTQATAKSNSPFVGDIHYTIIYDGETLAHLTLHVDLGTITAQNTYQPAPSAT